MATNTNTDLTEEDAADLQFPKENDSYLNEPNAYKISSTCSNCYGDLTDRFILCVQCIKHICCECFAKGIEFDGHKNDHKYSVFDYDFCLFENSDWCAREELILLEGLIDFGNWSSIAKKLPNRTVKEIKEHYDYFYLLRGGSKAFPQFHIDLYTYPQTVVPYRFRLDDIQDPPRYMPTSSAYHTVAGYNAARSDFELEYDTNAEDLIANLEYVDNSEADFAFLSELQCAIIRSYNLRLLERERRRKIIRDHGLILHRKLVAWLHRYDVTVSQSVYDRLIRVMQFYDGQGFEYLMEGLHRVGELKIQIARLCDFRKEGITTLEGARLYLNLKQNREESLRDLKAYHLNPIFNAMFRSANLSSAISPISKRRGTFTPIDIIGMPGYEKLQCKERELCRNNRLVPLTYLELKAILIAENNKIGHLKLLTARQLLKIDVNKTRKLYDFLVQEGYVKKPNN